VASSRLTAHLLQAPRMATVPMPRSTGALAALALHVLLALLALAVAADDALVGHVASGTATAALVSGAQGRWVEASRWALFRDKTVYELEGGAHTLVVEKPPDHADSQPLSLAAWAAQLRAQPTAVAGLPPPLLASVSDAPSQAAPGPHAWARRALAQGVGATPARGARPPHAGGEDEEPYPLPDAEWRFIPEYEGALLPGSSLSWTANSFRDSACFPAMSADASELQPGGAPDNNTLVVTFHLRGGTSPLCADLYLLATPTSWHVQRLQRPLRPGVHVLTWQGLSDAEAAELAVNGVRVFHFLEGVTGLLNAAYETAQLFAAEVTAGVSADAAQANAQFLRDYTLYNLTRRDGSREYIVPEDEVHSGDMFCVVRLDGLDPMIMWGTGSPCGHTVMALRIDGSLYVVESQTKSAYWPKPFIQRNPYREWMELAHNASYNVLYLPLSPEARSAFDESAAQAFFVEEMEGLLYGFQNFLSGWLDVGEQNMPAPLSVALVNVGFALVDPLLQPKLDALRPVAVPSLWNDAFAQRLGLIGADGTHSQPNITTAELYALAHERNITFEQLLNMPERDDWVYPAGVGHRAGPASVCDAFVCRMWKAAGLFAALGDASSLQCTEFTPLDVVQSALLDASYEPPAECRVVGPDGTAFCQVMGDYELFVPGYAQVPAFGGMRERCPSKAPDYAARLSPGVMQSC